MRILMVTGFYPPSIGGIEQHVQSLSHALVSRGHSVAVATLARPGCPAFERDGDVRVYRVCGTLDRAAGLAFVEPGKTYAPPAPDPALTVALAGLIKRERPAVVHGHDWLARSFLPLKAWSGARLVVTLHEYGLACAKWTLTYRDAPCSGPGFGKCLSCAGSHYGHPKGELITLANWATRKTLGRAVDVYLPVSQAVADGSDLAGGGTPFRVVHNFIPDHTPDSDADSLVRLAELPDEPFLLFVGALRRYKGVEVLLQAYEALETAPPLVLIGSAWHDTPIRLPRNAVMLRNWPHDAVMHAWRRSLLGLAPSVWPEPCPTVVMEAMVSGRAVIASRMGGLPELVADGETGLLVPPDDASALSGAMARLLADPALRERLGQAGKKRVIAFQAGTVVPQIERVYREVVGRNAVRRSPDDRR
ncbi:MAG: glycosyltransferase family 4 protein [Chloroflexota bacterium]|nr:glycosyltransferase family 4 protein [Chloroflexota bacterium]